MLFLSTDTLLLATSILKSRDAKFRLNSLSEISSEKQLNENKASMNISITAYLKNFGTSNILNKS